MTSVRNTAEVGGHLTRRVVLRLSDAFPSHYDNGEKIESRNVIQSFAATHPALRPHMVCHVAALSLPESPTPKQPLSRATLTQAFGCPTRSSV